jgi:ribose-phosphate pyrophosphokinase
MAILDAPLRRLFERIDFAPRPVDGHVKRLLDEWAATRAGSVAPSSSAISPVELVGHGIRAFSFAYNDDTHRYLLEEGGKALQPLLGNLERGDDLSATPFRRAAVRLRRLFDTVRQAGEPVLAEFVDSDNDQFAQLVVAPLSSDSQHIDGILGAVATRPYRAPTRQPRAFFAADRSEPMLFALSGSELLGKDIASHLGIDLSPHEYRHFEDGEHKARPLVSVRDRDVYVLSSLWRAPGESVNDKLCHLLFFGGCLRDGGAARVSAIVPYLGYARKDRKTKPRDPVTIRYVAQLFEAIGFDRVVTVEAHNVAAYQNAFRRGAEHLATAAVFARAFARLVQADSVTVVSPDLGGGKRAEDFREGLEAYLKQPVETAFMEKRRSLGIVSGDLFAGEVKDRVAIIYDDLISSGTTMLRTARACHEHGASRIFLAATHGLFTAEAARLLNEPFISGVLVTDSVPQANDTASPTVPRLTVLGIGELLGGAIHCLNDGGSITDLLRGDVIGARPRPHRDIAS